MMRTRRCNEPSRHRWSLAVAFASVLASGLPAARGACPAIASGGPHSLALKSDGSVWAWGMNQFGELGNGTFNLSPNPLPVQVKDPIGTGFLSGVTAIAGGGSHSPGVEGDGGRIPVFTA